MKKLSEITYDNLEEYFKNNMDVLRMESTLHNYREILSLKDLMFVLKYYHSLSKVIDNMKYVNLTKEARFENLHDMLLFFREESKKVKVKSAICFDFDSTLYNKSENVLYGHTYLKFITDKQKKYDIEKLIEVDEESMRILDSIGYDFCVPSFYGVYDKDTDKLYVEYKLAILLLEFKAGKVSMINNHCDKELYGGREIKGVVSNKLNLVNIGSTLMRDCKIKRLNIKSKNRSSLETANCKIKEIYIEEKDYNLVLFLGKSETEISKITVNVSDDQIEKIGKTEIKHDSIILEIRPSYRKDKTKELVIKELVIRISDKAYKEIKDTQYLINNLIWYDIEIEKITIEEK